MQSFQRTEKLVSALMLCGLFAAAFATPAQARDSGASRAASAACSEARQFALFQRNLRMHEGDTEPLQPAEPAECAAVSASNGDAQSAKVAVQSTRGATPATPAETQ
jgi:hypothetical protein